MCNNESPPNATTSALLRCLCRVGLRWRTRLEGPGGAIVLRARPRHDITDPPTATSTARYCRSEIYRPPRTRAPRSHHARIVVVDRRPSYFYPEDLRTGLLGGEEGASAPGRDISEAQFFFNNVLFREQLFAITIL